MSNQPSSEPETGTVSKNRKSRFVTKRRLVLILALLLFAIAAGTSYSLLKDWFSSTETKVQRELMKVNEYAGNKDTAQAVEHARKALEIDAENIDSILVLANLTKEENPDEAKQLYARALELQKKQDNPDEDGKNAITYWAAAGLAEEAGLIDQAKHYYQKVIDNAADSADSYEQSLVMQAREALARLQ